MPPDKQTLLTPADAARRILTEIKPLQSERIPLAESLGRVLAAEIASPIDIPQWDNSAMDGYAVRSQDVVGTGGQGGEEAEGGRGREGAAEITLRVVETIAAGAFPTKTLGPGECARIFTGAPIPQGGDAVIRQEDTTRLGGDQVRINDTRDVGANVRRRGEDLERGAMVFQPGTAIGPAQVGVLASIAVSEPEVYRRPRVAVLSSGDEIADLSEREAILSGRKIASSNTYTMLAMARQAGAEPVNLGIARDDPTDLHSRLAPARETDLLVTSGGMSVGEHDYLRSLLEDQGTQMRFWRLRMRPGAPVGFGLLEGVPWLGLPGNPVSTMVTFELFVRPAIRKLMGHTKLFRRAVPVRVGEPISTPAPLQHFVRVRLAAEDGGLTARLTGPQGSGILSSMAKADALLIVPQDRSEVAVGETLDAIQLHETIHVEQAPF